MEAYSNIKRNYLGEPPRILLSKVDTVG